MAESPESKADKRSLKTFTRAISILRRALKPDWYTSVILWESKKDYKWMQTTISNNSERKGSLEIGLYLEDRSVQVRVFFIRGERYSILASLFLYSFLVIVFGFECFHFLPFWIIAYLSLFALIYSRHVTPRKSWTIKRQVVHATVVWHYCY